MFVKELRGDFCKENVFWSCRWFIIIILGISFLAKRIIRSTATSLDMSSYIYFLYFKFFYFLYFFLLVRQRDTTLNQPLNVLSFLTRKKRWRRTTLSNTISPTFGYRLSSTDWKTMLPLKWSTSTSHHRRYCLLPTLRARTIKCPTNRLAVCRSPTVILRIPITCTIRTWA